jgi:hypothetical protein
VALAAQRCALLRVPRSDAACTPETRLVAGDARNRAASERARLVPIPPVLGVRKGDERCFSQLRTVADRLVSFDMVRSQGSVSARGEMQQPLHKGWFGTRPQAQWLPGRQQTAHELRDGNPKSGPSCRSLTPQSREGRGEWGSKGGTDLRSNVVWE